MEMHNKIEELTRKIHTEGLEKAKKEADTILAGAKESAEKMVSDARAESERILEEAKKKAADHAERMNSELRISMQRALANLKKEITELIQAETIRHPVKKSMADNNFMNHLLETTIRNWNACSDDHDLHVLVPSDQLESAENHLRNTMGEVMNNGLVLRDDPALGSGFEIQPSNGHYKISMTDEAFESLIREHFKPRTVEFLFGKKG
jgi:V/A-type H+-transporting ATPase subunit E